MMGFGPEFAPKSFMTGKLHITKICNLHLMGNRRLRYQAAVHVPDFDTLVSALELSRSDAKKIIPFEIERHYCIGSDTSERERECRNPVRERQLCSGDVGFVTWRSSSYCVYLSRQSS